MVTRVWASDWLVCIWKALLVSLCSLWELFNPGRELPLPVSASPKMSKHQNKMMCSIHILGLRILLFNMFLPLHAIAGSSSLYKGFPIIFGMTSGIKHVLGKKSDIHYIVIIIVFLLLLWDNISCKPIGKQEHPIWPLFSTVCCQLPPTAKAGSGNQLLSSMAISDAC